MSLARFVLAIAGVMILFVAALAFTALVAGSDLPPAVRTAKIVAALAVPSAAFAWAAWLVVR